MDFRTAEGNPWCRQALCCLLDEFAIYNRVGINCFFDPAVAV